MSPNKSLLIPALITILGLALGYFYGNSLASSPEAPLLPDVIQTDDLSKFKDLNLNFKIFEDNKFRTLEVFGESPVSPGTPGKKDIFAPI